MKRTEHERGEIQALIYWMGYQHPTLIIYKIENEGKRNPRFVKKNGIVSGIPDLHLAKPSGRFAGLFLEVKRRDGKGKHSVAQEEMGGRLIDAGYQFHFVNGYEEGRKRIEEYLYP